MKNKMNFDYITKICIFSFFEVELGCVLKKHLLLIEIVLCQQYFKGERYSLYSELKFLPIKLEWFY
jgi:hypothetical protein